MSEIKNIKGVVSILLALTIVMANTSFTFAMDNTEVLKESVEVSGKQNEEKVQAEEDVNIKNDVDKDLSNEYIKMVEGENGKEKASLESQIVNVEENEEKEETESDKASEYAIPQSISINKWYTMQIDKYSGNNFYVEFVVPKKGYIDIQYKKVIDSYGKEGGWSVELLDSAGNEYIDSSTSNETKNNDENHKYKIGLNPGTYRLSLKARFSVTSGSWTLPFIVNFKESNNFEIENNDTKISAQQVELNTEYDAIGREGSWSDDDYFKFTTSKKTNVQFSIAHDTNNEFSNYYLYDSNGKDIEFASEDYNMSISGKYYTYEFKDLPAGSYILKVYSYDSKAPYKFSFNTNTDWKKHWANKEIKTAMDKGWVKTTDEFRPDDSITRAEFVKIVNKAFGFTSKGTVKYKDVKTSDWWYGEVAIAVKAGYIDTKATNFRPNDQITREEVAAIVTTIKNNKDTNLDKLKKYKDANKVSNWAKSSVEGAIEKGYMGKGNDYFKPKDKITRAETVVTLSRIPTK